jgi:ATP-binding cassette subfamily B protein
MSATRQLAERARGLGVAVSAVHRFRKELLRRWRPLALALLCSLGYTAARLAEPWPLKLIFDNVLIGQPLVTGLSWLDDTIGDDRILVLAASVSAILVLALVRGLIYYWQSVLTARVGQEVVMSLRRQLFAHMQRLSLRFHHRASVGDLLTRLTGDINMLRELLVGVLLSVTSEAIILVGFVAVMFLMEWRLALVAVIVIPVVFVLLTVYSGRIRDAAHKQRRREGELASRVHQVLSGIHVVQAFARESDEDERLRSLSKRSMRSGLKATRLEAQLNRSVEMTLAVATAVTLGFGSLQVIEGRLTPGELIVFAAYMQSFYRPLRRISRVTERGAKAATCLERVTSVLNQDAEVRDGTRTAPPFRGRIAFEGVGFAYEPGQPVLHGIELEIPAGRRVALVGATGAGKSTLLGLVPRLWDPTTGRITIDGHNLRELTLTSLRAQVSLVPQDGMLFFGTIRENIAYGRPDATDAAIVAAARAAHLHDFIASLPEGYETAVGERGVTLSGGQRQRLAIARALVKDAPIVLLDEPTTGLDAEAEAQVVAALDRLLVDRTAVVIAHRLTTIERVDEIIVLDHGRVVERGTHAELLGRPDGRYRALAERQLGAADALSANQRSVLPTPRPVEVGA